MLKQILGRVSEGGVWTVEGLAREMRTTPELITAMLDDLVRLGYLKPVGGACGGACASCPMDGCCVTGPAQKVWTLNAG